MPPPRSTLKWISLIGSSKRPQNLKCNPHEHLIESILGIVVKQFLVSVTEATLVDSMILKVISGELFLLLTHGAIFVTPNYKAFSRYSDWKPNFYF